MAKLETTMFREYDLRGRVNEKELNDNSVSIIAKAYGSMLRDRGIEDAVVGYDFRPGSEEFTAVFIEALRSTGVNVIALGMILTPMMYSAQYHYQTRGGVMVTASHNPKGWLGFKLASGYSATFVKNEMEELKERTIKEDFVSGSGTLKHEDFFEAYKQDLIKRVNIKRSVKVVVNAGNGTPGAIVPEILRAAGCEVVEFLTKLDDDFPWYFPNPALVEMMTDTGKATYNAEAEIGFAIDGDGDRLGVTDEKGQTIWPDRFMILLSRKIIQDIPNTKIVFDVKCSKSLEEDILAHGGKPIMWKTGHSYIKEKLHEVNAPLAGEMSGHIFFGEPLYRGFDDSVFTALKLVEYLSQTEESFSQAIAQTPYYLSTPTLQVQCDDAIKYEVVNELVKDFQRDHFNVNTISGARVEFDDGWGLVRASSNLPVLVMRFEAKTQERLDEIQNLFREKFKKYSGQIGDVWESG